MRVSDRRPLGDASVSPVCLGCMLFGGRTPVDDARRILSAYADAGGNFVDTANLYGRGVSEEVLGGLLRDPATPRDRFVVTTKLHYPTTPDASDRGNGAANVVRSCEASLKRLGMTHVDVLMLHRPDASVPIDETLEAMERLVRAGKVRMVGTSTFGAGQLAEAILTARVLGVSGIACEQAAYNLLDRRAEREILPLCRAYGVAVTPWSPLAGGLLTGKYAGRVRGETDGRFDLPSNRDHPAQARRTAAAAVAVEGVLGLAAEAGVTASQFSLRWLLERSGVTSVVVGPRTMAQLADNLGAMDFAWSGAWDARVDKLAPAGGHVSPFYEGDFGPGVRPRWFERRGVDQG